MILTFVLHISLEGLFPDELGSDLDAPQLKYFHCSTTEGISSGDVAFLAGFSSFLQ